MASLYDISIPGLVRGCRNLQGLIDIAMRTFDTANDRAPDDREADLLAHRLCPDMASIGGQIQFLGLTVQLLQTNLAGKPPLDLPPNAVSLAEIRDQVEDIIRYLHDIHPVDLNDREDQRVKMATKGGVREFSGRDYVLQFVIPNFFFHLSMIYAILRTCRIDVGKFDFLGWK